MPIPEDLIALANSQHGYFTTRDAKAAGVSRASLTQSARFGRPDEYQRKLYRLRDFPLHEHDRFVAAFVWSDGVGVVSHGSAIELYGLSDWIQHGTVTMTFPKSWKKRRFPGLIEAFFADLKTSEITSKLRKNGKGPAEHLAFKITKAPRTLQDFKDCAVRPDQARMAIQDAERRRFISNRQAKSLLTNEIKSRSV